MAVASSAVLPHDLEDLIRILFGQAESFLREDRPDVVEVRRHQVGDLHRVEGGHHRDLHELLHDERTFSGGTRAKREAWLREYCCSGLSSPRAAFSLSRMTFSSVRDTYDSSIVFPHARLRCSGRTTACLMRPPKRTSTRKAFPRRPTTVPVIPWNRWCGQPFWTLDSMTIVTFAPTSKVWNERVVGESPRCRGPRRNFCRVFSMIPFDAFTIARHRRGRRGRRARGPRTPRRVVPRGTAWCGHGPHGPTP